MVKDKVKNGLLNQNFKKGMNERIRVVLIIVKKEVDQTFQRL